MGKAEYADPDFVRQQRFADGEGDQVRTSIAEAETLSHALTRRMSDAIAYGLLVYTGLQIFVTMRVISGDGGSMLPLLALVVLVCAIIPMFRRFEHAWEAAAQALADDDVALRAAFRHAQRRVWIAALGLPFAITALYKGVIALF